MEIRLPDAATVRRAPPRPRLDIGAATGAGLHAGALTLVLLIALSVAVYDESPWRLLRMMAAIAQGPAVLGSETFSASAVATGIALHLSLAVLYAAALCSMVQRAPRGCAPLLGLAFGAALYSINLHGFTTLFPWLAELRTADTFAAHLFFGLLAAQSYTDRTR